MVSSHRIQMSKATCTGRPKVTRRNQAPTEETKMNTLSITSTKTMTYDATTSAQSFAIIEKLASVTGTLLQAARKIGSVSTVPALRAAQA
jgi:hypothetical protein